MFGIHLHNEGQYPLCDHCGLPIEDEDVRCLIVNRLFYHRECSSRGMKERGLGIEDDKIMAMDLSRATKLYNQWMREAQEAI